MQLLRSWVDHSITMFNNAMVAAGFRVVGAFSKT